MRWDFFMSSRSAGLTIFPRPPRVPLTPQPAFAAPWALHMPSLRDSVERLDGYLKQEYGLEVVSRLGQGPVRPQSKRSGRISACIKRLSTRCTKGQPDHGTTKRKQKRKKTKKPDGKVENATQSSKIRFIQQAFPTFPQARLRGHKPTNTHQKASTFNQDWTDKIVPSYSDKKLSLGTFPRPVLRTSW